MSEIRVQAAGLYKNSQKFALVDCWPQELFAVIKIFFFFQIKSKLRATMALIVTIRTKDPQTKIILKHPSSSGWLLAAKS